MLPYFIFHNSWKFHCYYSSKTPWLITLDRYAENIPINIKILLPFINQINCYCKPEPTFFSEWTKSINLIMQISNHVVCAESISDRLINKHPFKIYLHASECTSTWVEILKFAPKIHSAIKQIINLCFSSPIIAHYFASNSF